MYELSGTQLSECCVRRCNESLSSVLSGGYLRNPPPLRLRQQFILVVKHTLTHYSPAIRRGPTCTPKLFTSAVVIITSAFLFASYFLLSERKPFVRWFLFPPLGLWLLLWNVRLETGSMLKPAHYLSTQPCTDLRICQGIGKSLRFKGRGRESSKIHGAFGRVWGRGCRKQGLKCEPKGVLGDAKGDVCEEDLENVDAAAWLGSARYYVSWLFPLSGMLALQCLELGPWLAVRVYQLMGKCLFQGRCPVGAGCGSCCCLSFEGQALCSALRLCYLDVQSIVGDLRISCGWTVCLCVECTVVWYYTGLVLLTMMRCYHVDNTQQIDVVISIVTVVVESRH